MAAEASTPRRPPSQAAGPGPWRSALAVACESSGFAVPISIGATALLYAKIGPTFLMPGLVAALLGMVLLHLATARSGRPMVYSARVMDASMLVGFLHLFIQKMPGWGLDDTPEHRLLLVVAVSIGAALLLPLLYALRLQRFARMIPTPVFYGFNTALAVTLLLSELAVLWGSRTVDGPWFAVIAVWVAVVAIAAQAWLPRWPAGVVGMVAGALVAWAISAVHLHQWSTAGFGPVALVLPVQLVPWRAVLAPDVATWAIVQDVLLASSSLALLVFVNTVVGEAATTQIDDAQSGPRDWWPASLAGIVATLGGSMLLSASMAPTYAAVRVGRLDRRAMLLTALCVLAALGSGLASWIPPATVSGLLLYNAWISFHRPSLVLMLEALRGLRLGLTEREDLAMIGLVVLASVVFNLVIGVFVGVIAGLVLYAWRNGRRLARVVEDGTVARSNYVRSRADSAHLAEQAQHLRYVELEGALFFGAAGALHALLRRQCAPGHCLVVDWAHVISIDSTVAAAFARATLDARQQQTRVAVSGASAGTLESLRAAGMQAQVFPDADRALEWAEAELIQRRGPAQAQDVTAFQDALTLLRGFSNAQRQTVERLFERRHFGAGETVFEAGGSNDELMVILHGSVDILLRSDDGRDVRLARLRRGAVLGELSFLNQAPRSATAVAMEDVLLGVMSRERFDALNRDWPDIGQLLALNLARDLADRLRRTSRLAVRNLTQSARQS